MEIKTFENCAKNGFVLDSGLKVSRDFPRTNPPLHDEPTIYLVNYSNIIYIYSLGFQETYWEKEEGLVEWMDELKANSSISNFVSQSENKFNDAKDQLLNNLEKYDRSTEINEEFVK